MLRITVTGAERVTVVVEGRLSGPWVEELARCWSTLPATHEPEAITGWLDGVTFIDAAGTTLCRTLYANGTALAASGGCMTRAIVDEITATSRLARKNHG